MTSYKLYGRLDTGSAASEAALAEAGADYVVVAVAKDSEGARAEGYHGINPRGQVPALILPDGTIVTEGTAILLHIADAFPLARLAPVPGTAARARHDRWLLYFHANLYEGELRRFYPDRYTNDPAGVPGVKAAALDYVRRHYALFEAELGKTPYALGADMTALDIYLWMLVQWFDRGWLAEHCPRLLAVTDRVAARPAVAPIHAAHFG